MKLPHEKFKANLKKKRLIEILELLNNYETSNLGEKLILKYIKNYNINKHGFSYPLYISGRIEMHYSVNKNTDSYYYFLSPLTSYISYNYRIQNTYSFIEIFRTKDIERMIHCLKECAIVEKNE